MIYFKENYNFLRFQRASNIFQGVHLYPGEGEGVQMLISIETYTTFDFPGGGPDHLSPLLIRAWFWYSSDIYQQTLLHVISTPADVSSKA